MLVGFELEHFCVCAENFRFPEQSVDYVCKHVAN